MKNSKSASGKIAHCHEPPGAGNPLDAIETAHRVHAQICDVLEAIADGLPDDVDCRLAINALDSLRFELPLHHIDEEEGLFPLLERRAKPKDNITDVLARLALEHATDESFAEELDDSLDVLSHGGRVDNPNMVGYMLRGFFENYRRHLHWENTLVLPLARKRLLKEDLRQLHEILVANRASYARPRSHHGTTH